MIDAQRYWLPPLFRQVLPCRVFALDEEYLFLTSPSLDLLLASDGILYPAEGFVADQTMNLVLLSESVEGSVAVLPKPHDQITGDSDI